MTQFPILAPDVELRLDYLEAGGTFSPPRPRYRGLLRGLICVPIAAGLVWALFVVLP